MVNASNRPWGHLLTVEDEQILEAAGYGVQGPLGSLAALVVVDATYDFVGDRPEPILDSIAKFPHSCGEKGWQSLSRIRELLDIFREAELPILYTRGPKERFGATGNADDLALQATGTWAWKNSRMVESSDLTRGFANEFPPIVAPRKNELVIEKTKPSAFFGTDLTSYLIAEKIDTVFVAGSTTSGCVRATVVDAFSFNFRPAVVASTVFDRVDASHFAALCDMDAKYARIVTIKEAADFIRESAACQALSNANS